MTTVKHLLNWYKSVYGSSEVFLALRRRAYCGRSLFSIEKIDGPEVNLNYNNCLHSLFGKCYLAKYLKDDKLTEAVSLAYYLKTKSEDSNSALKSPEMKVQDLQMFLNGELLKINDASEWMKRINNYMNKNIAIRKQNDVLIKKKFLSLFKDCKFFCSQVYNFTVHKAKLQGIPSDGLLCVNVTGIYLFEEGGFRIPKVCILINDLIEFEQRGSRFKLKYLEEKKIRTIFLDVMASKQLCEDIATSIILALRENRYYVYSYLYIARMLPVGLTANRRSVIEHLHGQRLAKCNENLSNLGDNLIPFNDLPFTQTFNSTINRSTDQDSYYYPYKPHDLNRDTARETSSKKLSKKLTSTSTLPRQSSAGIMTATLRQSSTNPMKSMRRESNVRFEGDNSNDDSSGDQADVESKAKMIDPSLLSLSVAKRAVIKRR